MNWTVFLQTDHAVKQAIRRVYSIPDSDKIPVNLLMPASGLVAIVNTVLVMPFECVKTHLEKINPSNTYVGAI